MAPTAYEEYLASLGGGGSSSTEPEQESSAYDAYLESIGSDEPEEEEATTGALPALGMENLETETSGASNLMGYIPSIAIADKAAQLAGAPKGSVTHLASSGAMAATDWLPGLLEEVGKYAGLSGPMIPEEGTIKRLQEEQEKERVSILAQLEGATQTGYAALSGASEIVGGAAPIGVAGRVGRLLSGTKGKVLGSLTEGAVGFLGSTAGRTAEERIAAIKDPRLLGAVALGVTAESIGARHIAAEAVKSAEEPTAKSVTKSVQKSIESDPTIHAIHEARESAATVKIETSELTSVTEAALSDPIDRLLTESLDTADEAASKVDVYETPQDWPALEMVRKPLGDASEIEAQPFRDYDDGPQPRTVEDAAAEYRDAMRSIAPKVEEMAGRKYDRMAKRGKVPQHEGAPLSREQFVERITTERIQKLNGNMAGVLLGIEQNGAGETIRALDTQFDAILKKYKINPEEVGFRGVASRRRESALREGSKWISDQLGERPIHLVEDADLERLAAKAGLEGAPMATFDLLEKERIRRINSEPPEALIPGPMDSPGAIRQRLSAALEVADAEASKGLLDPELRDRGDSLFSRAGYRFSKAMGRVRSEGAYNLKVGRRLFGQSLTDVVAPLADRKFAEQRLGVMRTIREDARGEADVIIRQASVAITDLNREIDSFAAEQVKAGGEFNRSAMEVQIRDAYLDGDLDKLPPQIAQTIREKVDPVLSQLGDYVYKNTDDEAIKKAIEANRGKYLYRFFNIFADREAIFKKVETQTEAYQRFAKKIILEKVKSGKTRYADISERLHKEHADRLREQGLSEAEVVAAIDDRVQLEIHGLIESMIKKNLYAPGTRGESYRAIGALPAKHYEIERILNDADLREILGEEKHFSIAVMTTVEKIATDIERQAINSRFLSALQDSGLASETPRPGVFERVSKKTLDNVDREVVPESEVLYIHPEANAVLRSVRTAGEIYMQQLNKMTAWIKLNLILTPHNYASQWVGFPHMALLGGGTTGMARLLRRDPISGSRGIFLGPQVAKELIRPGQAARFTSASAEKFYKGLGFADMETVRELSDKLNRYGLDRGNELVFEAELATRPLLEGAKSPQTRAEKGRAAKGLKVATDEFRRPDIAAKVVVYKASLEDMLYKEGVSYDPKSKSYTSSDGVRLSDAEVEALEKESIRRTLMLTQDPRTTPAILRDMSYGVRGLAFAGFHGFIYQMTRAFGNSYKLAMDDAARMTSLGEEALRLEKAGDATGAAKNRAKAKRYGAAAADRALTTTVAAYLVPRMITYGASALYEKYEELKGKFFGDKSPKGLILDGDPWERGRSARRFMWDQQQNSNMMAPRVKKVKGRKKVLLIDGGRMDILDNTTKILRAFSQPGDVADKFAAVGKEIQNQYLSLGFYVESLRQFDLPEFDSTPEGLQDFAVGTAKEVGGLAMRFANPLLRGGTKMVSEPDSRMSTAFKLSTGAWVQEVDAQEVVGKKYDRDWRGASWVQSMRDEWKAANSFAAQSKVKMHYKRRWDNLMSEFMQNAADARGMADMSPSEIARSLNEARTSKSTGKEYKSPIPTWMHSTIASGRVVPLESYLSRIER